MIRVYCAGSYSADNVLQVFENMRLGLKASTDLFFSKTYAVFSPWLDYHFCLMRSDEQSVTVKDFYNYSMAWLEVSDAVLVLPNSEKSTGTQAEIKRAEELDIPVFYSRCELDEWASGQQFIDFTVSAPVL